MFLPLANILQPIEDVANSILTFFGEDEQQALTKRQGLRS